MVCLFLEQWLYAFIIWFQLQGFGQVEKKQLPCESLALMIGEATSGLEQAHLEVVKKHGFHRNVSHLFHLNVAPSAGNTFLFGCL